MIRAIFQLFYDLRTACKLLFRWSHTLVPFRDEMSKPRCTTQQAEPNESTAQ